jgi:hypothetical protein
MGTIADKLQAILNSKEAIRQAINNKSVEVLENDLFSSYATKINSIEQPEALISPVISEVIPGIFSVSLKLTNPNSVSIDVIYGILGSSNNN